MKTLSKSPSRLGNALRAVTTATLLALASVGCQFAPDAPRPAANSQKTPDQKDPNQEYLEKLRNDPDVDVEIVDGVVEITQKVYMVREGSGSTKSFDSQDPSTPQDPPQITPSPNPDPAPATPATPVTPVVPTRITPTTTPGGKPADIAGPPDPITPDPNNKGETGAEKGRDTFLKTVVIPATE